MASQFGDIKHEFETGQTVEEFVRIYFDFRHDFLGVVAVVVVAISVLFAFTFSISIRMFNFQRR